MAFSVPRVQVGGWQGSNTNAIRGQPDPVSKDTLNARTYGMGPGRIGSIDMKNASTADQKTGSGAFRNLLQAPNYTINLTRDSNVQTSNLGLGHPERPTLDNANGVGYRNLLDNPDFGKSTGISFGNSPMRNQPTYPSDNASKIAAMPDFKPSSSVVDPGPSTSGTDPRHPNFVPATEITPKVGTEQKTATPREFPVSNGAQHAAMQSASVSPSSVNVGTVGNPAANVDPTGVAGQVAQKITDVANAGMGLYETQQQQEIDTKQTQLANEPGIHAGLRASMYGQNAGQKLQMSQAGAKLGGSLFGIPGMIGGYMLGGKLAPQLSKTDMATISTNSGKQDRAENSNVYTAMSSETNNATSDGANSN